MPLKDMSDKDRLAKQISKAYSSYRSLELQYLDAVIDTSLLVGSGL
jgi:hypothetical protein